MMPDEQLAAWSEQFEEDITKLGFRKAGEAWRGIVTASSGQLHVDLYFDEPFPLAPPRVMPVEPEAVSWSWHRELDGALCLIAEDDRHGLWWLNAPAFIAHIASWVDSAAAEWADDRPDLDLDRYFEPDVADRALYLYDGLDRPTGPIRFRPSRGGVWRISHQPRPPGRYRGSDSFGWCVHIGSVKSPPRSWKDVELLIGKGLDLEAKIRRGLITHLLLSYDRADHYSAILLRTTVADGVIRLSRLNAAPDTEKVRQLRAGTSAHELSRFRVALVGVGALGSFVADGLVRSGIRILHLYDNDIVKPGNLVRHLASSHHVGRPKTEAVASEIQKHAGVVVKHDLTRVRSTETAAALLREYDLVIDCTADHPTTLLLQLTATALGKHFLASVIQNDGDTFRIDVLPPLNGAEQTPDSARPRRLDAVDLFEAGCGSPISPTPPYVVMEAAAATVRHAVGLLSGAPQSPAGEVRELAAATDQGAQR